MKTEYIANGTPKQLAQMVHVLAENEDFDPPRYHVPSIGYLDQTSDPKARSKVQFISPKKEIIATINLIILPDKKTHLFIRPTPGFNHEWEKPWNDLVSVLRKRGWKIEPADELSPPKKPGSPGLPHDELVYRLAMARKAQEIKSEDPKATWIEMAYEIGFSRSESVKSNAKLLSDACNRLQTAIDAENHKLLEEVEAEVKAMDGKEKI